MICNKNTLQAFISVAQKTIRIDHCDKCLWMLFFYLSHCMDCCASLFYSISPIEQVETDLIECCFIYSNYFSSAYFALPLEADFPFLLLITSLRILFVFFFCYIVCLPISMVAVFICSYNKREKPNYHPHTPLVRLEHFSRKYISTTLRNESMFWNKNFNKYVRRYAPTVHSSKNW